MSSAVSDQFAYMIWRHVGQISWLICVIVEQCISQCLIVDATSQLHNENVDIPSNVNNQKTMETCADCVFSPIHISKNHINHCIIETRQVIKRLSHGFFHISWVICPRKCTFALDHNESTIFHYVYCAHLSIFNVLTRPFLCCKWFFSESRKWKMIDILKTDKVIVMILWHLSPELSVMTASKGKCLR